MNEFRRQAVMEVLLIGGLVALVTVVTALVASSAEAQRWTPPPNWTPPPIPTAPPGGLVTLPPPPPLPESYVLREGSPQCAETWSRTVTIPSPAAVNCRRIATLAYLVGEVQAGRLAPGPAWQPLTYPAVTWAVWPVHVYGSVAGVPQWVCAAGIGTDPIVVSLAQDWRTLDLVSWETANRALVLLDRYDLTDGAIVAAATNAARAACPAN